MLYLVPERASALLVLAHGAGAGMHHPFMEELAQQLAARQIGSARYEFPYMAAKSPGKFARPDAPAVLTATVRKACQTAGERYPHLPLFAGGKSLGGRMSSTAQAESPLPGVLGLVFFGFPLHTDKKPATSRAAHLQDVKLPMLFLQGTRDALADLQLMREVHETLPSSAKLHVVEGADHSFSVLKSSGRTSADVLAELAEETARFCAHWRSAS